MKVALRLAIATTALPATACGPAGIYAAGGPSGAFRDMVKEFPAAPDAVAAPFFCSGSGTVVKEVPNG